MQFFECDRIDIAVFILSRRLKFFGNLIDFILSRHHFFRPWHVFVDISPATDADFVVAATFDYEPRIEEINMSIVECLEGSEREDEIVAQQMQQALDMENGNILNHDNTNSDNEKENGDNEDDDDDCDFYDLWNEDSI